MSTEIFLQVLSVCTFISTLSQFLTGIPICLNIRRQGKVGDISGVPFLIGFLLSASWTRYGFLRGVFVVIGINGMGALIFGSYAVFYLLYSWPKKSYIVQFSLTLLALAAILLWVQVAKNQAYLGILCIVLNILSLASPLAGLGVVIRNREVASLPLPMCFVNLLASMQWTLYAYFINDINIMIPNGMGILLAIIQLSLFLIFPMHVIDYSPLEKLAEWFTGRNRKSDVLDLEKGDISEKSYKPQSKSIKIPKYHGKNLRKKSAPM